MVSEQVEVCEENFVQVLILLKAWKNANKEAVELVSDLAKVEVFLMVLWSEFSLQETKVKELEEKVQSLTGFWGVH